MDDRSREIITQVAFKGAIDMERDMDLDTEEGQRRFSQVFGFLNGVLIEAVTSGGVNNGVEHAAQVIQGVFPGTVLVPQQPQMAYAQSSPAVMPQVQSSGQPNGFQVTVRGNQFGPLPDWLAEQAAQKGVTEVYDNRDRAQGSKRPWFRATTGGDNAPAFWPPR